MIEAATGLLGPNDPSSVAFGFAPEHERRTDRRTTPQRAPAHEKPNVGCSDLLGTRTEPVTPMTPKRIGASRPRRGR